MSDDDLRNCFAMFALAGAIMNREAWTPDQIWAIADDMVESRHPQTAGLPAIKRRAKKSVGD